MRRSFLGGSGWLRGLASLVLGAVLLAGLVPAATPAAAQSIDELRKDHAAERERRETLQQQRREAERQLGRITDRLGQLEVDLGAASERLSVAQQRERRANEAADAAQHQATLAQREVDRIDLQRTTNDARLAGLARDTYKFGAPRTSVASLLGTVALGEQPGQLSDAVSFLERGVGQWAVLVEESAALLVEAAAWSERAEAELRVREQALGEAADARDEAAGIHAEIQDLVSEVSVEQHRQERQVEELGAAHEDSARRVGQLNEAIHAEAERIRQEAEQRRREAEERRRREAEQRRQQELQRQREAAQREAAERAAARRDAAQRRSDPPSGLRGGGGGTRLTDIGGGLVTVGGITVASSIGPNLQALLDAARADGIVLGGHGYRSVEAQVRLRSANGCPDVWTAPASSCRVPTAIPGRSLHEQGLAIDFTYQGRTICFPQRSSLCRGNPAFDWLMVNAGRYGFRNLPSEAWHWSTTGR